MNMLETVIAIVGAVGGTSGLIELLRYWANRKSDLKRSQVQADVDVWHLYAEQLDKCNQRILELLDLNKNLQARYVEQTERLRETQARELAANERALKSASDAAAANARAAEAEQRNGMLLARLANNECVRHNCVQRDPPNEHTRKALAESRKKAPAAKGASKPFVP